MTELAVFREYEPWELGKDGYPRAWHQLDEPAAILAALDPGASAFDAAPVGVKDVVRAVAGNRCLRCGHPYTKGQTSPEWSPCDEHCTHGGPSRWRNRMGEWSTVPLNLDEGAERQAQWRILTVHHLNGRKHDLRWWNLAALCQRCHLQIQGRVQMERVWPWEHTDWFKPYAAGWYAYVYLGENLTRAQTLARLDELLALERAA